MTTEATGVERQLPPEEEQVVGAEVQDPRVADSVLPRLEEEEGRTAPLPTAPRAPLPAPAEIEEQIARQTLFGRPILRIDRYTGADANWRMLVRWDVEEGFTGDLHEISLLSDDDANTRYRIVIGNINQEAPDKQITTPVSLPWRGGVLPGGSSVTIEVRAVGGTTINVDAFITGSER